MFGVTINEHLIHLLRKPGAFLLRCHLAVSFEKSQFDTLRHIINNIEQNLLLSLSLNWSIGEVMFEMNNFSNLSLSLLKLYVVAYALVY